MNRTKGWRLIDSVVQINNVNKGGKGRRGRNELGEANVLEERRLLAATVLSTQGTSATTGGNGNSTLAGDERGWTLLCAVPDFGDGRQHERNGYERAVGSVPRRSSDRHGDAGVAVEQFGDDFGERGVTTAFISADGNTIAYESTSTNVVADQVNQLLTTSNVFLYNRVTGTTTLVSGSYGSGSVSGNGRTRRSGKERIR